MRFNNLTTEKLFEIAGVDTTTGKAKEIVENARQNAQNREYKQELIELIQHELTQADESNSITIDDIIEEIEWLNQHVKTLDKSAFKNLWQHNADDLIDMIVGMLNQASANVVAAFAKKQGMKVF